MKQPLGHGQDEFIPPLEQQLFQPQLTPFRDGLSFCQNIPNHGLCFLDEVTNTANVFEHIRTIKTTNQVISYNISISSEYLEFFAAPVAGLLGSPAWNFPWEVAPCCPAAARCFGRAAAGIPGTVGSCSDEPLFGGPTLEGHPKNEEQCNNGKCSVNVEQSSKGDKRYSMVQ